MPYYQYFTYYSISIMNFSRELKVYSQFVHERISNAKARKELSTAVSYDVRVHDVDSLLLVDADYERYAEIGSFMWYAPVLEH